MERDHLFATAIAPPHLAAAGEDVPDFIDRAVTTCTGDRARRKLKVRRAPGRSESNSRTCEPSGAVTVGSAGRCIVPKLGVRLWMDMSTTPCVQERVSPVTSRAERDSFGAPETHHADFGPLRQGVWPESHHGGRLRYRDDGSCEIGVSDGTWRAHQSGAGSDIACLLVRPFGSHRAVRETPSLLSWSSGSRIHPGARQVP